MLIAVAVGLLFAWSWIRSLDEGYVERDTPGEPEGTAFRPSPGRYHSEVIADDGSHVVVPLEVIQLDDERVELRSPWRPPEPAVYPMPPILAQHADRISLRVRVASTGQVEDVVGPDDHFDRVDAEDPDTADQLRAMRLEEQVDAWLAWQLTARVAQPLLEQTAFRFDASLPGYGLTADWSGTIDYSVGPAGPCPEAAGEEQCAPVSFVSQPEADGRSELSGRLLVGLDTGVEWEATLARDTGERRREVRRRLLPGEP